jgi:signal transduction histidine kinase
MAPGARARARYMSIIESQADRLSWLVEDLLTVSELESGKAVRSPRRIELSDFVARFASQMAPLASRKGVKLDVSVEKAASAWADESHLARILQNLIDNAIKYNKKGGSVKVSGGAIEGRQIQLTVRDTGIGIRPEDLTSIFQPFYRSTKARQAAVKGTGLGLHIIKSLVESNGGRIWAENGAKEGAAFHFTLPQPDKAEKV